MKSAEALRLRQRQLQRDFGGAATAEAAVSAAAAVGAVRRQWLSRMQWPLRGGIGSIMSAEAARRRQRQLQSDDDGGAATAEVVVSAVAAGFCDGNNMAAVGAARRC